MENLEDDGADGDDAGGGGKLDLRSYLTFASRAIRKRWIRSAVVAVVGLTLTIAALLYLPKSYSCSTVLMTLGSPVLDSRDGTNALAGAVDLIQRHENLEMLIRETGLVQKSEARRPPLLRLKDRMFRAAFGTPSDKVMIASLLGTLQTRIIVTPEKGDLTIKAEWSDAHTAAELAEAARESFLKARHQAEMSAFEDKIAILEGHATKLRDEIGRLAQQLKAARDEKLAELRTMRSQANKAKADATAALPRFSRQVPTAGEPDTRALELKGQLESLRAKLTSIEAEREQRLREEQAKADELKLKLTPSHPQVVAQEEKIAMIAQVPSNLALLRAEVKDMEAELRQRQALGQGLGSVRQGGALPALGAGADQLPEEVTELLQRDDNLDPALTAQLSGTVMKYSNLRNDLLTTHIELDTEEAAFRHRYQIIIPAEAPNKPDKPKPAVILGGGIILTLLISLLLPILAELRRGVMTERWQVQQLQLPIIAELRLPPYSAD